MYFPTAFAISLSIYPSLPPPFPFFPISPFNFDPTRNTRIASSLAHASCLIIFMRFIEITPTAWRRLSSFGDTHVAMNWNMFSDWLLHTDLMPFPILC